MWTSLILSHMLGSVCAFTFNYIFAYFWFAIWLSYQLFIHACSEAIFRKNIFSANFPPISDSLCEASRRTYSYWILCVKFVLIEYLTLNYIFAYFWFAIWLSYQLFIYVCSEANFRENYYLCKFSSVFSFSMWSVQTNLA